MAVEKWEMGGDDDFLGPDRTQVGVGKAGL